MPPSAITVCALPSSDLQIKPDSDARRRRFDRGAQSGAATAPMTSTSVFDYGELRHGD